MKIFDRWIEKQFEKRFPERYLDITYPEPKIICTTIHPQKFMACVTLEREDDDIIPNHKKLEMMAQRFIPHIADNMKIRRREDAIMNCVIYEAQIELIPVEKGIDKEEDDTNGI